MADNTQTSASISPPKSGKKADAKFFKVALIIFCVVIILGVLGLVGLAVKNQLELSKAVSVSNQFVSDIKSQNYQAAYDLIGADQKKIIQEEQLASSTGTPRFKAALATTGKVSSKQLNKQSARVVITFKTASEPVLIYLTLQKQSGQWRITSVSTQ